MHPILQKILISLLSIMLGMMIVVYQNIQAAPPQAAPILSANCVEEATVGEMKVYFCEGDIGPDFLINSVGFMTPEN